RNQIMLNRLNMNNFLLSGDPRDEEKVNKGLTDMADLIKRGEAQASSDGVHTALIQVESTEASWADNFAKPLIAKRHQVDSGDATVSDLQIFYLQKDPSSWLAKSSSILDQTNEEISKFKDQTTKSADAASNVSLFLTIVGTLTALVAGVLIAFYTARSISEPLKHLMTVTREIGDSGDLDQNIDIHRNDEIGALATTFNNMVAYLKEMASVSMAVAEGDLTVEVVPRSKRGEVHHDPSVDPHRNLRPHRSVGHLDSARSSYCESFGRHRHPIPPGSRHRYPDHGKGHRRPQPHQPGDSIFR